MGNQVNSQSNGAVPEVLEIGSGVFRVDGVLSFATSNAALRKISGLVLASPAVTFDLSGVIRVDSAGLALLLELRRLSLDAGTRLRYTNFPSQLVAIARVVGVDEILASLAD